MLIATGSSAKIPLIEGFDLNNVFTLRNYQDLNKIKQATLTSKKIVIVGAGFIGMEMASSVRLINPKAEVIIIDSNFTPFEKVLGKEIGKAIQR